MKKIRPRSLPVTEISNLADQLTAILIMTPYEQFEKIKITDSVGLARQRMGNNFDQLPVERDGHIIGLVKLSSLDKKSKEDIVSNHVDEKVPNVNETEKLIQVLQPLQSTPCIFVTRSDKVVGLIHRSDLNKQALRIYFYLWLTAAEMSLAEHIEYYYGDSLTWLDLVCEKHHIEIQKSYDCARKTNIETNAIEYAYFSDLVEVVEKTEEIRKELGFTSKNSWGNLTGSLVKLRNDIMHPTRLLLQKSSKVSCLSNCDNKLQKLVNILQEKPFVSHP